MCEAELVENVGMHMVGVGESADWLEYVLVVGKARKKKNLYFPQEHKMSDKQHKLKTQSI